MMQIKFCPDCGAKLVDNSKFCPDCGHPINNGLQSKNNNMIKDDYDYDFDVKDYDYDLDLDDEEKEFIKQNSGKYNGYRQIKSTNFNNSNIKNTYNAPSQKGKEKKDTIAIASLVCGILAILLFSNIGPLFAFAGIVLSIICLAKKMMNPKGFVIAGLVCSILGFLLLTVKDNSNSGKDVTETQKKEDIATVSEIVNNDDTEQVKINNKSSDNSNNAKAKGNIAEKKSIDENGTENENAKNKGNENLSTKNNENYKNDEAARLLNDLNELVDSVTADTDVPSSATIGQKNALRSAKDYLNYTAFSHQGLIKQLKYEGYSDEDAKYAADNCGADWKDQAIKSAKGYLEMTAFSEKGLIEQLEYEGFSNEEAMYGAQMALNLAETKANASGMTVAQENALKAAKSYLSFTAFSHKGLIEQLKSEGYSAEDAKYAADNCGADWNEQAAQSANNYLNFSSFSRKELIDQLVYEGYTQSQAEYGVKAAGY